MGQNSLFYIKANVNISKISLQNFENLSRMWLPEFVQEMLELSPKRPFETLYTPYYHITFVSDSLQIVTLLKFRIDEISNFLMSNPIFSQNFLFFSVKSCLSDRTHFSNTPSLGANISFFKKTKNKLFLRKTRLHTLQCRSIFEAIQKQFWSNFNKIVR